MAIDNHETIRDAWDEIALGFDEYATPLTIPLAEEAIDRVDLRSDDQFLDVGAGSGALSLPAASRGAGVVATDISPTMIERLTARARTEGLTNLEARVMDGCSLDLEDGSFDISASQNGVSLFPEIERGLAEMVRVTRPGGRVLIVAFGHPQKAEFLEVFMGALEATIPGFEGPSMEPPPLPFQVADPEKLHELMGAAGLNDVTVDTINWDMKFESAKHFWNMISNSNPIGAEMAGELSQEQITEVEQVLDTNLRERSGGRWPVNLKTEMNIGIGTK